LFNPFTLWRLVVLVMALSSLGHIAQRMIGARYGLMIAGLFAGFISATAAIAAMAHRSRADPDLTAASAAGAAASLLSSMIYMMILIFVVSPRLLSALTAPLGAAALTLLGYSVVLGARSSIQGDHANAPGRAFNFGAALLFVGLVATVTVLCRLLAARLGSAGALIGAAATGLTDAHAAALSMATLDQSGQIGT
ncbi:DUF4010 domain-containing protein, partial [Staphylococcus xylosus]|uniref:DUF4010 domain-containing protein n=1 Tax=Staphylococcus xylosus TaxID=1288 RepID=UPI00203F5F9E